MGRRVERAGARGRWHLLAALLVLLGLSLSATTSAFAAGTGISGKVSEAGTHDPIAGIEACAFSAAETSFEEEAPGSYGCASTDSGGEYTISGLNAGGYFVTFGAPFSSTLNYVRQFYEGKSLGSEAKQVSLVAGSITAGIDAELEPGAEISGTVTEAATGAPLEGIFVCAVASGGASVVEIAACARSVAGGSYSILGLAGGSYKVFFFGSEKLAPMFYNGKTTTAEADLVTVAAHGAVSGIDAALAAAAPSSPGAIAPGSPTGPLSSSPGGLQVRTLVQAGLRPVSRRISVRSHGRARLGLKCLGAARCKGEIDITVKLVSRSGGRRAAHTVPITKSVEISIPAGATESLPLLLDRTGDALLRGANGTLDAHLTFVGSGDTAAHAQGSSVTLLAEPSHGQTRKSEGRS